MERWEYEVKELYGPWTSEAIPAEEALAATKENLNRLGAEGWELVSVLGGVDPASRIPDYYMILKRKVG